MEKTEKCILTNMCMIYDGDRILVIDKKKSDWQGVAFPGGHVEPGEAFTDSVIREVKEETGLDIWDMNLCGVKQYIPQKGDYRYIVFCYKTDKFKGELLSSEEGEIFWIEKDELKNFKLASGFEWMYEVFTSDSLSETFCFYDNGVKTTVNK